MYEGPKIFDQKEQFWFYFLPLKCTKNGPFSTALIMIYEPLNKTVRSRKVKYSFKVKLNYKLGI